MKISNKIYLLGIIITGGLGFIIALLIALQVIPEDYILIMLAISRCFLTVALIITLIKLFKKSSK